MSTITASDVMKLRTETSAPLMDCKQALSDSSGNFDTAKTLLRERLGSIDKTKVDSGKEGLLAVQMNVAVNGTRFSIVEIGTETDFAAKNQLVIDCAQKIADNKVPANAFDGDPTDSLLEGIRSITGENIILRSRINTGFEGDNFDGGFYLHHDRRTAAAVVFVREGGASIDDHLKQSIAMHVVAASPSPVCVKASDVPPHLVATEKAYLSQKALESGKTANIQEKIVEGGLSKFCARIALLEQPYVKDPTKKVKDILPVGVSIVHFERMEVGQS